MKRKNNEYTHGIHPYHAKFIPSVPREFIKKYTKENDSVLDPFCGSGTTLLECMLLNRYSCGVDISYLAYLISKAKTELIVIKKLNNYYDFLLQNLETNKKYKTISFENKGIWYTKKTLKILDGLYDGINRIKNEKYRIIFEVLFSSILKTVCNKRDVWNNGYVADNILPNKEYNGDALKVFKLKYKQLLDSYEELNEKNIKRKYIPKIKNCRIQDFKSSIKFDAVVTSPPYPFAVDFVRYYRLSYYWLGKDIDEFTKYETGARNKRKYKTAVDDFYEEMENIYKHIFSLVKVNGYFCMTVADTQRKKIKISFIDWLYKIFINNGWILVSDTKRKIESQSMGQKRIPTEHKLVFRKVKK